MTQVKEITSDPSMRTSLAIDIGNTRTKLAVFRNGELVQREVWDRLEEGSLKSLAYNQNVGNIILSSVAAVPEEVEDFLEKGFFYLRLTTETPLPITIEYGTPGTLGKDRVAAAVGAFHLFPKENCLVVDAGTCITSDILSDEGVFLGGNISPGIGMRLKAMHHFTAKLPLVVQRAETGHGEEGTFFLGNNTENAILNGGQMGAVWEMKAFIGLCRQRFKNLKVIFTGGDAGFFVNHLKTKIFADPNLVLIGLNKILQYNVEK